MCVSREMRRKKTEEGHEDGPNNVTQARRGGEKHAQANTGAHEGVLFLLFGKKEKRVSAATFRWTRKLFTRFNKAEQQLAPGEKEAASRSKRNGVLILRANAGGGSRRFTPFIRRPAINLISTRPWL